MRVNQLFELREEARKQFAQAVEIENKKIEDNPEEQQLIERVMKALGKNMANTEYTVDMLANDIGMSRANLYKKMQTMIGITPNDYMRNVRLKKAAELLAKSDIPVNQISLLVGFQTPRYFSQCFRKMFGVTPSEYREGKVT
jgi:AraC-like DNA-binding protein